MALHLIRGRQLHGRIVHGVGDCQRHAISGMHVPLTMLSVPSKPRLWRDKGML